MRSSLFAALRIGVAMTFLGALLGQVVIIPWFAADEVAAAPEVTSLRWPYSVAAIATLACVQVALVAMWALLAKVQRDEVFTDRAFAWVDAIIAAALIATVLTAGVCAHLLFVVGVGGPGVILILAAALVGGSTFALLMTVMRGLLRHATSMRGELAGVV